MPSSLARAPTAQVDMNGRRFRQATRSPAEHGTAVEALCKKMLVLVWCGHKIKLRQIHDYHQTRDYRFEQQQKLDAAC